MEGEERYSSGTVSTDYTYTGQYSNTDDFGLMYYQARWYDPQLGRFAQADSIVPGAGNPLAWDRYAYAGNNPVRFRDSSGHMKSCGDTERGICGGDTSAFLGWANDTGMITKADFETRMSVVNRRINKFGKYGTFESLNIIRLNTQKKSLPFNILAQPEYQVHDSFTPDPYGLQLYEQTNTITSSQPFMLIQYDASRVAWGDIYIDGAGAIGDITGVLQPAAEGLEMLKVLRDLGTMGDLLQVSTDVVSIIPGSPVNTDLTTTLLDFASLVPGAGLFSSGADVVYQLGRGFTVQPYQN